MNCKNIDTPSAHERHWRITSFLEFEDAIQVPTTITGSREYVVGENPDYGVGFRAF